MKRFFEVYGKSVLAVLAAVLGAVVAAGMGDGHISSTEWVNVAVMGVGAASVFAAPNVPGAKYTKSVLAALAAGLTVMVSAIVGGITVVEWYQIGAAVLGALGVYVAPYKTTLARR